MLKSILSPEDCAKCRFCCSYRRASLWETAKFDLELLASLKEKYPYAAFKVDGEAATIDISMRYRTDDPNEEALCWFNNGKVCILGADKPFECSVWPLRVMRKDSQLVIALSSGCHVVSSKPINEILSLIDGGLGRKMFEYAEKFPAYIREYRENYPILKVLKE